MPEVVGIPASSPGPDNPGSSRVFSRFPTLLAAGLGLGVQIAWGFGGVTAGVLALVLAAAVWLIAVGMRLARVGLIAWGGLIVLVALLLAPSFQGIDWVGCPTRPITFTIVDAETQRPVPNASVRFFPPQSSDDSAGQTGADGRVTFTHQFMASGYSSYWLPGIPRQQSGALWLWHETVEVEAQGYCPVREKLDVFTPANWNLYGPPLPPVTIPLKKQFWLGKGNQQDARGK